MSLAFKKEHGEITIALPPNLDPTTIKEVRIRPKYDGRFFEAEYVYQETDETVDVDTTKAMGIDFGLDNLAICVTTDGALFILDGKALKSINHQYNKRIAHLQCRLTIGRNNRVRDYMNKAARYIVSWCIEHGIGTLVVGYNPGWKRCGKHLGKKCARFFLPPER